MPGAAVLARIGRLVFGAFDPKAGACGSLYNLCADPRLNHEVEVIRGVGADPAGALLRDFFANRRDVLELTSPPEGCESGRIGRSRKPLCPRGHRGFESHSLRRCQNHNVRAVQTYLRCQFAPSSGNRRRSRRSSSTINDRRG